MVMRHLTYVLGFVVILALIAPVSQAAPAEVGARIIGGSDAPAGSWPSFARLSIIKSGSTSLCGGTLITPTIVLTAAHCAKDAQAAGSLVFLGGGSTVGSPSSIAWSSSAIHPSYNASNLQYDVALITLASAAAATPMPLIAPAQDALLAVPATLAVAGYGLTSNAGSSSTTLKELTIPFVADATCAAAYTAAGYAYSTATMICAGSDGPPALDSCSGDSGGPLTLSIAETRTLVGDVSWGPSSGCASAGLPGVYGRISAFRDWIAVMLAQPTIATVTNAGSAVTVTWSHASATPAQVPLTFVVAEASTSATTAADATSATLNVTSGGPKTISVSAVSGTYTKAVTWAGTPTPTRAPVVSARLLEDPVVGAVLTVDATSDDPWADALTYQWTRAGVAIAGAGATSATFTPTTADAGATLGVVVSARNGVGVGTATATFTEMTVLKPTLTTRTLVVRGTPKVGRFLRVARPAVLAYPMPQASHQWLRNGRALKDKTRAFYRVTAADRGQRIACRITLTNSAGSTRIRSAIVTIR